MDKKFVERRDGSFYVAGSRVPLAQLASEFQRGESAEAFRTLYPTLSLEQVHGAIAFCLGYREEVKKDLIERERIEDEFSKANPAPQELREKIDRARRQVPARPN